MHVTDSSSNGHRSSNSSSLQQQQQHHSEALLDLSQLRPLLLLAESEPSAAHEGDSSGVDDVSFGYYYQHAYSYILVALLTVQLLMLSACGQLLRYSCSVVSVFDIWLLDWLHWYSTQ